MATSANKARRLLNSFNDLKPFDKLLNDLKPANEILDEVLMPGPTLWSSKSVSVRRDFIEKELGKPLKFLKVDSDFPDTEMLRGNIENYVGMTCIPTGIIGPLHIRGTRANGDFFVPLATSEGALIASYHRGAKATRLSGGVTSVCLTEGVQRSPLFRFDSLYEVGKFMNWVLDNCDRLKGIVSSFSRHTILDEIRVNMEGNNVILIFEYTTGDASGQNMVTFCTDGLMSFISENCPVKPKSCFIESNFSGDKKATSASLSGVRGKKVTAEAKIKREVVRKILFTSPEKIHEYWINSTIASVQSGTIGVQGHFANGLSAIFLACGQDVACVAESYSGITRMELTENGDLYIAVTLPGLMVGTVGGGTGLPTQSECLEILGCKGENNARKFSEICAATVLAGELSIAAAIAGGNFSKAHRVFGRPKH